MARGRMISKSLSTSQKRAALHRIVPELAEFCQQLYPLLVAHADDFGRLSGDPFTVKHAIDPTSPRDIPDFEQALRALTEVGLIVWYPCAEDRWFIQVTQFEPHQAGLHKRTSSKFPEPPEKLPEFPGTPNSLAKGTIAKFPEIPSELKRTELKGTSEEPGAVTGSRQHTADTSPTVHEYPTVGPGGAVYRLSEAKLAEWAKLFPTIDIRQEARHALAWLLENPGRRKTVGGMPKFLVNWFTRTTNDGRRAAGSMTGQARGGPEVRTVESKAVRAVWRREGLIP